MVLDAINAMMFADSQGYVPFVDYRPSNQNHAQFKKFYGIDSGSVAGLDANGSPGNLVYFDPNKQNKNLWEYFFEPVSSFNLNCSTTNVLNEDWPVFNDVNSHYSYRSTKTYIDSVA